MLAAGGVSDHRSAEQPSAVLVAVRDQEGAADRLDHHWAATGGGTSERGADSAEAHARAVLDKHGNIMVLMTHNTDLGDSFEREADDPQYFYQMSVPGYAFGVNALLYALTH